MVVSSAGPPARRGYAAAAVAVWQRVRHAHAMTTIKEILDTLEHIDRVRASATIPKDVDDALRDLQIAIGKRIDQIAKDLPKHIHQPVTDG
jgi:dienelactone hydrolase